MSTEPNIPAGAPDDAAATLAMIHKVQAAGRRRGLWPRWTRWTEVLLMTVFLLMFSYSPWPFLAFGIALAGVAFRFWCVSRFGALARWNRIDVVAFLLVLVMLAGIAPHKAGSGPDLLPLAVIGIWAASAIALDELKRRGVAKRERAIELA